MSEGGAALGLAEQLAASPGAPDPNDGATNWESAPGAAALLNSKPCAKGVPTSPAIRLLAGREAAGVESKVNDVALSFEAGAGADPPKLKPSVASAGPFETGSTIGGVELLLAEAAATDSAGVGATVSLALKVKAPWCACDVGPDVAGAVDFPSKEKAEDDDAVTAGVVVAGLPKLKAAAAGAVDAGVANTFSSKIKAAGDFCAGVAVDMAPKLKAAVGAGAAGVDVAGTGAAPPKTNAAVLATLGAPDAAGAIAVGP